MTDLSDTAIAELCLVAMALGFLGFIVTMLAKDIYQLEVPPMIACPDCGMQLPDAKTLETHVYERQCEFTPDGDERLLKALAAGADRPHPTEVLARVLLRLLVETPQHTGSWQTVLPSLPVPTPQGIPIPFGTSYTAPSRNPVDR